MADILEGRHSFERAESDFFSHPLCILNGPSSSFKLREDPSRSCSIY